MEARIGEKIETPNGPGYFWGRLAVDWMEPEWTGNMVHHKLAEMTGQEAGVKVTASEQAGLWVYRDEEIADFGLRIADLQKEGKK